MPTITIRNLPPDVLRRIKLTAARNGRSMEEEVRAVLRSRYESRAEFVAKIRESWKNMPKTRAEDIERWIAQTRGRDGL